MLHRAPQCSKGISGRENQQCSQQHSSNNERGFVCGRQLPSSPNWLFKGETTRKGDVVQRVETHIEPAGCQAAEQCTADGGKHHPVYLACSMCLPLCLLQFSCGCGPILAQVLLDTLSLVPPPCASLFWPLQHNVISSLGAAQL